MFSQNSVTGHACAEIVDLVSIKGSIVLELTVTEPDTQNDYLLGIFILTDFSGCTANTLICQIEPANRSGFFVPLSPVTLWEHSLSDVAQAETMVKVYSKIPAGLGLSTQINYQSSYQIMIIYN